MLLLATIMAMSSCLILGMGGVEDGGALGVQTLSKHWLVGYTYRTNTMRWETNVGNGVVGLEFDRKDIEMNKV